MKLTSPFVRLLVSVRDDPMLDEPMLDELGREQAKIGEHAKIVFYVLLTYANDELRCWPSLKTIAAGASINERTVQRAINLLEKNGRLTISTRTGRPSVYHLSMQCTAYTHDLQSGVQTQSSINIHGSVTPPTTCSRATHDLQSPELKDLLKEIKEREPFSLSNDDKNEDQEKEQARLACSYADGRFHVERAARAWLQARYPSINLDTVVAKAETKLSKQKPREIVNALAYLDACCKRAGGTLPEQPVHNTRTSEPATESRHRSPDDEWQALQEQLLHVKVKKL